MRKACPSGDGLNPADAGERQPGPPKVDHNLCADPLEQIYRGLSGLIAAPENILHRFLLGCVVCPEHEIYGE